MRNEKFYWLLREPRDAQGRPVWSVERLAAAAGSSRAHVTEVLNNVPGHGHRTRGRLVRVLMANFTYWRDMLVVLGWSESGELRETVSQLTFGKAAGEGGGVPEVRGICSTWKVIIRSL